MKFKDHKEFFDSHEDDLIPMRGGFLSDEITVDEMYLHFKARMAEECMDIRETLELALSVLKESTYSDQSKISRYNNAIHYVELALKGLIK